VKRKSFLLVWLLLATPLAVQALLTYTTNSGTITITGYTSTNLHVVIPRTLAGLPVTSIGTNAFRLTPISTVSIPDSVISIGDFAFWDCESLTSITIPSSVTSIGDSAFEICGLTNITIPKSVTFIGTLAFFKCYRLTGVFFQEEPPSHGSLPFGGDVIPIDPATVYFLPGTTGWSTFGVPHALWLPQIQSSEASFGVKSNQFWFNVTWADGMNVVVERAQN
jgi:hypothetical protein